MENELKLYVFKKNIISIYKIKLISFYKLLIMCYNLLVINQVLVLIFV